MKPLKIISLNVRGLRESKKRTNIFEWLRMNKYDIILLQETYIHCKQDTETITREWGGRHHWSFGDFKSRGVGILFSESFRGKIDLNSISTDQEGRIISVMVEINDITSQVCNVYCPTHSSERSEFLDKLPSYIKGNIPLITGGDWNCMENPQMDKFGGNPCTGTSDLASLRFLTQTYDLVDVVRKHNPLARSYTWFSPDSSIGVCIDRFYVTQDILRTSTSSTAESFPYSDHDGISFEFTPPNTPKRGPGYWKLNTSILGEQILQNQINHSGRTGRVENRTLNI